MANLDPILLPELSAALRHLQAGRLVAFPTETVYGLGADATNPEAMARLYQVKGRPSRHPVIVHLADANHLDQWAVDIPPEARKLASACWPGPLTLILRRAPHVLDAVTGGQDTVGLRVPSHPVAQALLHSWVDAVADGCPAGLAAPSANRFGRVSPTCSAHVRADLGADVSMTLDGGPCAVGVESTIVDCTGVAPRILRPGGLTAATLSDLLGRPVGGPLQAAEASGPRVSGGLPSHYAPRATVRLARLSEVRPQLDATSALLHFSVLDGLFDFAGPAQRLPCSPEGYAQGLYAALRQLDTPEVRTLWVEAPPETPGWEAVQDRLRRAAAPRHSEP